MESRLICETDTFVSIKFDASSRGNFSDEVRISLSFNTFVKGGLNSTQIDWNSNENTCMGISNTKSIRSNN